MKRLFRVSASDSILATDMRKRFVQLLRLTLFVTLIGSTADAQNSATVLVLVHANLIDGVSPDVLHDATVVVRDGRIESVGGNVSAPTCNPERRPCAH